ncbi:hypothetical protein JB92DRAFT_2834331 [Gautieria morchelliformis]|nr:hypothetical protein JB92DRAFT_2834331 [Gautieria morchelliformis]
MAEVLPGLAVADEQTIVASYGHRELDDGLWLPLRFSRLPMLMTAFDISHANKTLDGPPEVTKREDDARLGDGLTEPMPNGIPIPTATTRDSLPAEPGSTTGHAPESKNNRKRLPRVLRDCQAELQSA